MSWQTGDVLSESELIPATGCLLPLASGPRPSGVPGSAPEASQDSCQQASREGRILGQSLHTCVSVFELGCLSHSPCCCPSFLSQSLPFLTKSLSVLAALQSGKGGLVTSRAQGACGIRLGLRRYSQDACE